MKTARSFVLALFLVLVTASLIVSPLSGTVMPSLPSQPVRFGAMGEPQFEPGKEAPQATNLVEFGALKWCYLWCTTVDSAPNSATVTFELVRTHDGDGSPISGTVHFLLVPASANITLQVLRTSPLPGILVTPTVTKVGGINTASHEFTNLAAGAYQIVTLITLPNAGVPGTPQWGGYYVFDQSYFSVARYIPSTQTTGCTWLGCINTQTFIDGRMRISGVITGTRNGERIQGPIQIMLMSAHTPLLVDSYDGSAFNTLPLAGKLFDPTITDMPNGRAFSLNLIRVQAGQVRTVILTTFSGTVGKPDWVGSFTWTEDTLFSVQYLANIHNEVTP